MQTCRMCEKEGDVQIDTAECVASSFQKFRRGGDGLETSYVFFVDYHYPCLTVYFSLC